MSGKEKLLRIKLQLSDGRIEEFEQKSLIIGSGPAANLRLSDASVSSIHAILRPADSDGQALISDLGSDTGTRVNGREIQREANVSCGDVLKLGDCELKVVALGDEQAAEELESRPAVDKAAAGHEPDIEKEATPVQRPPRKAPPPLKKEKEAEAPKAHRTQIVRRREIPRSEEIRAVPSGQNFFERKAEEAVEVEGGLVEVKVMWGPVAIHSAVFPTSTQVTIGGAPDASIRISTQREDSDRFLLLEPAGNGCVVHIASDMKFDVRDPSGKVRSEPVPEKGATRTYSLKAGERCRVMLGQLAFVVQYVKPAQGVFEAQSASKDYRLASWVAPLLVVAVGLWVLILLTPRHRAEASEYLKNPARFAKLLAPSASQEKKKTFEEIKKKKEEKPLVEDTGRWKKVTTKTKQTKSEEIPREVKEKRDREIAKSAGILGLLKGRGGGTGDNASSVFGGSAMANLDQSLSGLQSTGMGDSSGFGGLGVRGGGIGGGGGGLGLGGLGTGGYGRGSGEGYGSVKIGQRGKQNVQVVKGRTKVVGGLSQEVVGRYIQKYWNQFKYCYERELSKDPNLAGKVTMTFTISGNGRVSDASIIQTSMNNANVEECVLRVVRRIHFPEPKGGGEVIVTYPFMFTTAG